jgi:osmotically-inducible protein OsmY
MPDWVIYACLGPVVSGLSGFATRSSAQNTTAPAESPLLTAAATTTHVTEPMSDEKVRARVESALRSDPYFYDAHVTVSMENGNVVLQGFVSGPWDLLDAIRIARKAAGNRRVIDDLEILLGRGKK